MSGYYQTQCKEGGRGGDINVSGSASPGATKKFYYEVKNSCSLRVARIDAYPDVPNRRGATFVFERFGKGNGKYTITDEDVQDLKNGHVRKQSY